jgi:hypothetical protein
MQMENKIRRYYYKNARKNNKAKLHSINPHWGYSFLIAGIGLGILFLAFILEVGFNNSVLSSIGVFSLLLVITGIIILVNNN